jgi:hypothetical protein
MHLDDSARTTERPLPPERTVRFWVKRFRDVGSVKGVLRAWQFSAAQLCYCVAAAFL